MVRRTLYVFIMLIFASAAFAEDKEVTKFEDIVVTATRTEKSAETAPGNVKVVTKTDMEKRNIQTVDAALNTLPGVFNRRVNMMDTLSSVTVGGIPGQNRTLILRDGVPLNNAYTGDVTLTGMSTGDIERIEVVRGPFSSLYGGYAMGGVVNIISRMPEKREFTVKSGYGTSWHRGESLDDLQNYYLSYGDRPLDKLSMLFHYGYKSTNGYPKDMVVTPYQPPAGYTGWSTTTTSKDETRYLIGDRGDNTWRDYNIGIKAVYDFTKVTKLNASFMKTSYKYNYDGPHTYVKDSSGNPVYSYTSGSSTVRESSYTSGSGLREIDIYNVNFETELGIAKTKLAFGLNDEIKNWYTTPNTSSPYSTLSGLNGKLSSTPNRNYNTELQFSVPLFSRHIVTFGGTYKHASADTEERNLAYYKDEDSTTALTYEAGGKDRTYALFVQDEIMILNNLTAYIGFREDWWETYDGYADQYGAKPFTRTYDSRSASSFSPKASIVYKPFEITTLRASAGKAFRAPTVYELYRTWISTTNVTYNGNPELNPEKVKSWDIGITQGLWKGAKFSATYFENYMKDLIYRKTVSSTQQDYINAGKAESKGTVLEVEQRFDKWLRLFSNFTYTDARIKENDAKPTTVDKRLTYLPDKMFNIGAEVEVGPASFSVTGRYVSKRYTDDENKDTVNDVPGSYDPFFTADAKVSYKVAKFATVSFAVDNIANESHYESYKAPGRLWFSQLELKF